MKHIKLFEQFLIEGKGFKDSDVKKSKDLIDKEIGNNPGYFFLGDDDDIETFDKLWNAKKYKEALSLLADVTNNDISTFNDIEEFINNEN